MDDDDDAQWFQTCRSPLPTYTLTTASSRGSNLVNKYIASLLVTMQLLYTMLFAGVAASMAVGEYLWTFRLGSVVDQNCYRKSTSLSSLQ